LPASLAWATCASKTKLYARSSSLTPKDLRAMLYYPLTTGATWTKSLRVIDALQTSDKHGVPLRQLRPVSRVIVPPKDMEMWICTEMGYE
jgi:hypothetical protein